MFVYTKENGIQERLWDVRERNWFDAMVYKTERDLNKLRIRPAKVTKIEVTVPDTIDTQDWEYVPNKQNGKTIMAVF